MTRSQLDSVSDLLLNSPLDLSDDALRLAARAAHADVPVTLRTFPGAPHVLQGFAPLVDEAAQALDQVADFINGHIQPEGRS